MSTTIKDVAKFAEVSISTVSRVINDSKPVSDKAKKRVLDAIDKLDYKPNELARSLVMQKSNIIGVVVTDIGKDYISQLVRGMEEIGRMYDYDILLSSSYDSVDMEIHFSEILKNKQAEAIIVVSENYDKKVLDKLVSFRIPYIYLNRNIYDKRIPSVSIDYKKASMEMTRKIIELGHEKILYVSDSSGSVDELKIEGFSHVVDSNGLEINILRVDENKAYSYNYAKEILRYAREKGITYIYCSNDRTAVNLLNYAYDMNISIPDQYSISGGGGLYNLDNLRPSLTKIEEPFYDIGAVSIRMLIKNIKENKEIKYTHLPSNIIKGQSTTDYKAGR